MAHTLGGPVEDRRADIVVIAAGHTGEVGFFLTAGSGPASRSTRSTRTGECGDCSVDVLVKNTECVCGPHRELLDPRTPTPLPRTARPWPVTPPSATDGPPAVSRRRPTTSPSG
ncbi:hypothetical protein [Streptomyces pratensis]|uniref:hypothetical protein n=1 Tax=Streptomyces pratensis TaxID=1169025 RepID=UPI001EE3E5BD|nr:hypothetical protein [Streptomyces pratensis]